MLLRQSMPPAAPAAIEGAVADVRDDRTHFLNEAPSPTWIAAPHGYEIPVRRFGEAGIRRPVVMLHGLESHSGWFVQSARRIAAVGLPVHAFDRCGSGVSAADGGRWSRLEDLLAEVDTVADGALAGGPHRSIHLVGHCFGALVAFLYAALYRPQRVASVVLATPALYTRTDLAPRDKLRVLRSVLRGRDERVPIPLAPEELSELEPFVQFVRDDPLALSAAPARLFYEVRRARGLLREAASALRAPILVAIAGNDSICDNRRNRRLLERVSAEKQVREYPGARHILEWSGARDAFLDDLAAWFERQEAR